MDEEKQFEENNKNSIKQTQVKQDLSNEKELINSTKSIDSSKPVESKKSFLQKNNKLIISVVPILFLVIAVGFFFVLMPVDLGYDFQENIKDVYFVSNDSTIESFVSFFKSNNSFIVAPQVTGTNSPNNSKMANDSMNLFLVVFSGAGKKASIVLRIMDGDSLLSCETNYFDSSNSERISKEECLNLLDNPSNSVLLIDFPNETQNTNYVLLKDNSIVLKSKDFDSLKYVSFVLAEYIFPNARNIIEKSNYAAQFVLT